MTRLESPTPETTTAANTGNQNLAAELWKEHPEYAIGAAAVGAIAVAAGATALGFRLLGRAAEAAGSEPMAQASEAAITIPGRGLSGFAQDVSPVSGLKAFRDGVLKDVGSAAGPGSDTAGLDNRIISWADEKSLKQLMESHGFTPPEIKVTTVEHGPSAHPKDVEDWITPHYFHPNPPEPIVPIKYDATAMPKEARDPIKEMGINWDV